MEPLTHHPEVMIPFRHKERNGRVVVSYGRIEDPVQAGFDSLGIRIRDGLSFDINISLGYSMMYARIESYEGFGIRTFCGWVQVITRREYDSYEDEAEPIEQSVSVDLPPSLQNLDLPFAAYGNLPQLFDAPCRNLGQHPKLECVADTFLTTVPLRSRDEEITRLLGFRWGYIEYDASAHKPAMVLPLVTTGEKEWNSHISLWAGQYPGWRFGKA